MYTALIFIIYYWNFIMFYLCFSELYLYNKTTKQRPKEETEIIDNLVQLHDDSTKILNHYALHM